MTFDFIRIPWKDVVVMAADVARNGFNVSHDFGKYRVIYRTNCLVKSLSFISSAPLLFSPQLKLWQKLRAKTCQLHFGIYSYPTIRFPSPDSSPDASI